jgi:hypothetical protein
VGFRAGLDGCGEEKISCPHQGSHPEPSSSVASRYTDYAILPTVVFDTRSDLLFETHGGNNRIWIVGKHFSRPEHVRYSEYDLLYTYFAGKDRKKLFERYQFNCTVCYETSALL